MGDPKAVAEALLIKHKDAAVTVAADAAVAALQGGDLALADHWKKVVWHAERLLLVAAGEGHPKH